MKTNALNWFELYVTDLTRAREFYETILGAKMEPASMEGCTMSMFPCDCTKGVGGALTKMEGFNPGPGGTLIYLNVEGDLDGVLSRVWTAGGKVIRDRMAIPPHGFIGIFEDSEGNVVGLHSMT